MTTTADALRYVADSASWLARHPDAPQAFDELEHIAALVDVAIDVKPPTVYAGPCDVCRRDVYAAEGAETAECRPCHLVYPMRERREWLLKTLEDRLERSTDIARALTVYGMEVTRKRIDNWHSDGMLMPHGRDFRDRPLYRVGDVMRLVSESPSGRRRAVGAPG